MGGERRWWHHANARAHRSGLACLRSTPKGGRRWRSGSSVPSARCALGHETFCPCVSCVAARGEIRLDSYPHAILNDTAAAVISFRYVQAFGLTLQLSNTTWKKEALLKSDEILSQEYVMAVMTFLWKTGQSCPSARTALPTRFSAVAPRGDVPFTRVSPAHKLPAYCYCYYAFPPLLQCSYWNIVM